MELAAELHRAVQGEVRFDAGSRATYSTDASNYRQVPIGVVVPKTVEDAVRTIRVCHEAGVPVLSRGGGTSLAGQCCNEAVVLDWSKYCTRLISVDVAAKTCIVEPGIALDQLNDQLASHELMVGPKPSTHVSCTIGGMVGNNSCGSTAQAYGKMVDSVVRLEVLTHDGCRAWVGETSDEDYERIVAEGGRLGELYQGLRKLRDDYMSDIRTRYPKIPRRVSGYNLDSLLPENGFNVAKALVGSESTLVTVLRVEIQLVDVLPARTLVVLGFSDITKAADCVPAVLPHKPVALEGVDEQLVQLEHSEHLAEKAIKQLPKGSGWLMVQFAGKDQEAVDRQAQELCDDLHRKPNAPDVSFLDDPAREEELWQAREAGLGATAYPPQGPETHEGWEDAAVPPEKLGDYLRDFRDLLERYEYENASLYGHFGQGCVHTRIPFDLKSAEGVAKYRRFAKDSAELVVSYGGSLSGEHGDGQSRGELLPLMFGPRLVEAFGKVKALFDPDDLMNPGKVVHPHRLDQNLRQGSDYRPWEPKTHFSFPEDDHRFANAAARCVGVGKCRGHESGVMCPSYRATREEEHSTRGRARLLFEMLNGEVIQDGWQSQAVHDALDLCLACKGCQSDCPVNVDMATYKAEFLSHHYEGKLRPRSHYSMGWLPLWARLAAIAPSLVNSVSNLRPVKALGGIAREREVPFFARQRLVARLAGRTSPPGHRGKVLLWPDTFTNNFHPAIGEAAVQVLETAGFEVITPDRTVCCGLTWISTGQLAVAERVARRTLETLKPQLRDGTPILVLEPSCAAVFRDDLPNLLHGDQDAHRLAQQTKTLAELLTERAPDWRPPVVGRRAVAQPHCHHHAVLGFETDEKLMRQYGIDIDVLDAGCCGLAGNFGFEQEHYDVSMACAEDKLLPALRQAGAETLVLADGFSCRTQIDQSDVNQRPMHLAEVLAAALHGTPPQAERPSAPGRAARTAAAAAAVVAAAAGPLVAWLYRRSSR